MVCLITPWMTRNLDTFNKNLGIMNEIKDKHQEDFKKYYLIPLSSIYPELKDTLR
jgi:hypothetical protein